MAPPARFRPVSDAALVCDRSEWTIRNWAASGRIPRLEHRGQVLVDLPATYALSQQAGRRNRTPAA